jgi:hypothetical protein
MGAFWRQRGTVADVALLAMLVPNGLREQYGNVPAAVGREWLFQGALSPQVSRAHAGRPPRTHLDPA